MPVEIIRAYRLAQRARTEYYNLPIEYLVDRHIGKWIDGVIWELEKLYPELKTVNH